ncbi:MAG: type II secretion system F family protein [Cellulomonas sp.]
MSVLVAVLVAAALLGALGPRGRSPGNLTCELARVGARERGTPEPVRRSGPVGLAGEAIGTSAGSFAGAITAVGSALRSGQPPASAWRAVLGCAVGPDGVPTVDDLLAATHEPAAGRLGARAGAVMARVPFISAARPGSPSPQRAALERRAEAVVAAGRLAATLGAPLAPVLDRVAESVVADDEVDGERRAALSGPRSTATLLGWLPLLGIGLGFALGADPVGVVLRGGAGTTSAVVGAALLLGGRRWTARLVSRAMLAGSA